MNLDGQLVRVIYDIATHDTEGNDSVIPCGTEFTWNDSSEDQVIDGRLHFIHRDEVELVIKNQIQIEGNEGGDYLNLEVVADGLIKTSVGHCYINTIDAVLPVEVITAIFSDWLIKGANGSIEQGIKNVWEGNDKAAQKYIEAYRQANELN